MTKSLVPQLKKWTIDEKRLLVILLLTIIYPVFVTSFYALYLFVLLPSWLSHNISHIEAHHEGWYHLYWLFVTMLWVIICALILPFFKKKTIQHMTELGSIESSPHDRKMHSETVVKIEVKDREDSQSNLSRKSEDSINNIKKNGSDIDVETEESIGKSRENLNKSCTSLERKKLTQSGEFLNDFMSSIQTEETVKNETVCEVHAEEKIYHDKMRSVSDQESGMKEEKEQFTKPETSEKDYDEKTDSREKPSNSKAASSEDSDTSSEGSSKEDLEPRVEAQEAKSPQMLLPLKINEATVEQHKDSENLEVTEEVEKLDNDAPQKRQKKKATPTIDTSRASTYYECSMPTPKTLETPGSQNNTVFLYVNPDAAATEDNIILCHGGEVEAVQESKGKEAVL